MGAPLLLEPHVAASGVAALGSLGSTFLNGVFNRSAMADQVAASKELMDYQWEKFQSPLAQVNAMAHAGINPAVAFGQGGSGFTATPSAAMPTNTTPQIGGVNDIANFVKAMAEAKKAGLESTAQDLQNEFSRRTLEDRIRSVALQNKFTEEETNKVVYEWQKLVGEANLLQTESELKKIDLSKHEELLNWQLKQYADKHNLDKQQFDALKEQLPVILDKLKAEKEILDVDASIAKGYKESMTQLGVLGDVIRVISQVVKIFK